MKRWIALALLSFSFLAFSQEFRVGFKVVDFTVKDLNGRDVSFASLRGPVTVVTFIATRCPVSNSYNGPHE